MKKLVLAASIATIFSSTAFAVTIDGRTIGAVAPKAYANELVVSGTTEVAGILVTNVLGFGVSADQTRYIRYDLSNAAFAGPVLPAGVVLTPVAANTVVSQGGAAGQTFVILQITAGATGNAEGSDVNFIMPVVKVTSKAESASIKYSLYESAADAAAGGATGLLRTFSGSIANFPSGITFSATPNTTTADVTTLYKTFKNGETLTRARIGNVTYAVNTAVNDPVDGTALVGADITRFIDAGSKLVLEGADLSAASAANALFLSNTGDCGGAATPAATAKTATKAEFVFGATEVLNKALCFVANGTTPIAAQNFTVAADIVPFGTATTADQAAIAAGAFDRDGTILRAAFAETPAGSFSGTVNLANTSAVAATFSTRCLTTTGAVAGKDGAVAAGQAARFGIGSVNGLGCPTNTRGVELILSVPEGSVIGSVVRQDTTTGQAGFDGMVGNTIKPAPVMVPY